jgi:hypothetical protein
MAMQAMGWWHAKRHLSPKQTAAAEDAAQGGGDQADDDVTHHSCLAGSGAEHSSEHNGILFSHTFFRQVRLGTEVPYKSIAELMYPRSLPA